MAEAGKEAAPANTSISLQVPGDLYCWADEHWVLKASGQVAISSGKVTLLNDEGPACEFLISPDPLCVFLPHSGSDRGWSFTAEVGETEERLALRFTSAETAKKVKEVLSSFKPPTVPVPPPAPLS